MIKTLKKDIKEVKQSLKALGESWVKENPKYKMLNGMIVRR